jgi:hypothetical protein
MRDRYSGRTTMCEQYDSTGNVHILLVTHGSCFGVKMASDGGDKAPRPSQKEAGHCASNYLSSLLQLLPYGIR